MLKKRMGLLLALVLSALVISGCSLNDALQFFGKEKIDPPVSITLTETEEGLEETEVPADETSVLTVTTDLYLIDKNGYVVPQTFKLPGTESIARQALEYLVTGGPVQEYLPNGFRAVLPADTNVSINVVDSVATVNFSNEFKNYSLEDEKRILQAVTWTLTQFDSISAVKFQLNGHELNQMPVGGTPIGEKFSRANGINHETGGVTNIREAKPVLVYYVGGEAGSYYYVPVTKYTKMEDQSIVEVVVKELVKGPYFTSNLQTDFMKNVSLVDIPVVANGLVTLNFNEAIYTNYEEKMVSDIMMNALVLSLTEQTGIETVSIMVEGQTDIKTQAGQSISEAVSRPVKVNTQSY